MSLQVRPVASDDAELIAPLDQAFCARLGTEEIVSPGSLSFFARSGHSFVLERQGDAHGFVLAQAIWDGRRPTVAARRVVAKDASGAKALLEALIKSAYDAGVYGIVVEQEHGDDKIGLALASSGYARRPVSLWERMLGSRGAARRSDGE